MTRKKIERAIKPNAYMQAKDMEIDRLKAGWLNTFKAYLAQVTESREDHPERFDNAVERYKTLNNL